VLDAVDPVDRGAVAALATVDRVLLMVDRVERVVAGAALESVAAAAADQLVRARAA
jgi:hypothetical protein